MQRTHYVRHLLLLVGLMTSGFLVTAQNYPVYNSYYVNPYLYNPAEAATDYTYIFVNHRQQWMNIEGAPSLSTVNFTTMFDQSRGAIGAKLSTYKRGMLHTTDALLTYAYGIGVTKKSNLYFGLSGGAITNTIRPGDSDLSDPAIARYQENNIQPVGNFGMLLRSESGLHLGVALPQLFTPKFNSSASFEHTQISPLDNVFVTAYYRKRVSNQIVNRRRKGVNRKVKIDEAYAPLEVYLLYKYSKFGTSQAEGMAKLNLSPNFWLGAGYRQSYGMNGNLGLNFNHFMLSYSYEPGNQPEPAFSRGSHEIQIGLRLGDKKEYRKKAPELRSRLTTTTVGHRSSRFQQDIPPMNNAIQRTTVQKTQYYVIIKVFGDFASADAYKQELRKEKFNANVFYYEKDRRYYVHVLNTEKSSDAYQEARNLKTYTKLKTARVLVIQPSK